MHNGGHSRKQSDSKPSNIEKVKKDHSSDRTNSGSNLHGYNKSSSQVQLSESTGPNIQTVPTNYSLYHDNSGDHGDKDYRPLQPRQPPTTVTGPEPSKQRFDQTRITLNKRFQMIQPHEPFSPTESITVDIERNIPGNEPAIIPRDIYLDQVIVVRQKNEGSKPLCQRPEFLSSPQDEYIEKRIVRVSNDSKPRPRNYSTPGSNRLPPLSEQWTIRHDESPVQFFKKQGMTREELDSFLLGSSVSPHSCHGDRDERLITSRERRSHIDSDERVVLEKRRKGTESFKFTVNLSSPPDLDQDLRQGRVKSKFEHDPDDLRHSLTKKRDKDDPHVDARQRLLKKREEELRKRELELKKRSAMLERKEKELRGGGNTEELPDFSNRPDKFQYVGQPEQIPKGGYYFEHDNRDNFTYFGGRGFRGRGRRFSRVRGSRGSYRGAVYNTGRKDTTNREWKHDKFEEVDDDKPTSTTTN